MIDFEKARDEALDHYFDGYKPKLGQWDLKGIARYFADWAYEWCVKSLYYKVDEEFIQRHKTLTKEADALADMLERMSDLFHRDNGREFNPCLEALARYKKFKGEC